MTWALYLDDVRNCPRESPFNPLSEYFDVYFELARTSEEAIEMISKKGLPVYMSLDHDLGGDDSAMIFCKKMVELYPDGPCPSFRIHSSNPEGKKNLISFLLSWQDSLD